MAEALHLVGGSVACMAAALAAAKHRPVHLYADPDNLGGGFAGLRRNGLRLSLGMRLLELDYEDPPEARRPLAAYDPATDIHRPFIDQVRGLVESLPGPPPRRVLPNMRLGGRDAVCAVTTADIATLPPLLPPELRARIAGEAAALLADPAPPAWRPLPGRPAQLENVVLERASRDHHGATLHGLLMAPLARLDPGWATCPAAARRRLWAALFHPATVLEAFRDGRTTFRPHRPLFTLDGADAVARMQAALGRVRLHAAGRVQALRRDGGDLLLRFADGAEARLPAVRTMLGMGPEEGFAAAGIAYAPVRLRGGFAWVRAAERDLQHVPAALLLQDAAAPAFRISDNGPAGPGQRLLAIEFGHRADTPGAADATIALQAAGLLREGAMPELVHAMAGPAQVSPSAANRSLHAAALARLAALLGPGPRLLGALRRFGLDSFNDQVVDGLHAGAVVV